MAKFKRGDRVRIIDNSMSTNIPINNTGTVDQDNSIAPWVLWDCDSPLKRQRSAHLESRLEKIEEGIKEDGEKETMSDNRITNPVRKLRERVQGMDDTTKILQKYDLEDATGEVTDYGRKVILDQLWEERRDDVAKELAVLEDEENRPAAPAPTASTDVKGQ